LVEVVKGVPRLRSVYLAPEDVGGCEEMAFELGQG
jgi:hypothetical protein